MLPYNMYFSLLLSFTLGSRGSSPAVLSCCSRHAVHQAVNDVLTVAARATHRSMIQTSRLDALISVKTCETIRCSFHGLYIISVHIQLYISCITVYIVRGFSFTWITCFICNLHVVDIISVHILKLYISCITVYIVRVFSFTCNLHVVDIISVHILKLYLSCITVYIVRVFSFTWITWFICNLHVLYIISVHILKLYISVHYYTLSLASILIQSVYISSTYAFIAHTTFVVHCS